MSLDPYRDQTREQVDATNARRYRWWVLRRRIGAFLRRLPKGRSR